jgi:hypothetical protein
MMRDRVTRSDRQGPCRLTRPKSHRRPGDGRSGKKNVTIDIIDSASTFAVNRTGRDSCNHDPTANNITANNNTKSQI